MRLPTLLRCAVLVPAGWLLLGVMPGCAPRVEPIKTTVATPAPSATHGPTQSAPALDALERAAKTAPKDAKAQARYGSALVEAGQAQAGIARLRAAVALDPHLTAAWHNLALAAERQGWLDMAADAYARVVAQQPDHAGEWVKLGYALIQLGRYDEAERAFRRAAALQPHASEPLVALASSFYADFKFEEAIATLKRALALNPRSAAAYADLAAIQLEIGRRAEAEQAIRSALAIEPDSARAWLTLGRILAASPGTAQQAEARQALQRALALDQPGGQTVLDAAGEAEAAYFLGLLARQAGQHDAAILYWRRALALDSTRPDTLLALGQALAGRGGTAAVEGRKLLAQYQRVQAQRDTERKLQQRAEMHPEDGKARLAYGKWLLMRGNLSRAVWELREAARLLPGDTEAQRTLAEALRHQGRNGAEK